MKRRTIEALLKREADKAREGHPQRAFGLGFRPVFYDHATCTIYSSCHTDGKLAMIHIYEGLPDDVVIVRSPSGQVLATKSTLVAGFERHGYFYTRAAAARAVEEWI